MVWVVANKERTRFLSFNDDDEPEITGKYVASTAFDSPEEAVEWADKLSENSRGRAMSNNFDGTLFSQLR